MNAALAAMPALMSFFYKLGLLHPRQDQADFAPLMHAASWFMLAVLSAAVFLYAASAVMLTLRRRGASDVFWAALVAEFIVFVLAQGPALDMAFAPEARMATAGLFLLLLAVGVLLSLMEPPRVPADTGRTGQSAEPDLAHGPR
jgi:hypothetical protein